MTKTVLCADCGKAWRPEQHAVILTVQDAKGRERQVCTTCWREDVRRPVQGRRAR